MTSLSDAMDSIPGEAIAMNFLCRTFYWGKDAYVDSKNAYETRCKIF